MAKLSRKTKDITTVPEAHRALYTQPKPEGDWVLTEIDGHDDTEILRTVRGEAATLRVENKKFKDQQATFEGLDLEKYTAVLAENDALKAEKEALTTKDQKLIDKAVEARLKQATSPLELKVANYEKDVQKLKLENETFKTSQKQRAIDDAALSAFVEVGVEKYVFTRAGDDDEPDGLAWARRNAILGEDGKVTHKSGLPLKEALVQMRDDGQRAHWFGGSAGTGSGPSGGTKGAVNPWSAEHWNAEAQNTIQVKNEPLAKQLAAAAGVDVNAAYHPKNGMPAMSQY